MQTIYTKNAPQPAGHYSQAIIHNELIYVSGQLPIHPKSGEKCLGSIEDQTKQTIENVASILDACDSSLKNVLKITVYISNINLWTRVNRIYSEYFAEHRPARVVVPTKELHHGFKIEIEAIAAVKQD
jgi:2-iminobutanoate/2-iminopropanoate deaminase